MRKFLLLRMRKTWEDREYSQLYLLKGRLRPDSTLKRGGERSSMAAGRHGFPFRIVILSIDFKKNKICWESESLSVVSDSLRPHGLYSLQNSPGQNTGKGSLSLLQGIFPTQGSNPGLPHCRQILYQLSHQRSPKILEWVAYPFSRGSSSPRNRTGVSCVAGGFFTCRATREDSL